jgi:hypothetical protein
VHGVHAVHSVSKLGIAAWAGPSITHAAWDVDAVHGVHAMDSVGKLGTARGRARQSPTLRRLLTQYMASSS